MKAWLVLFLFVFISVARCDDEVGELDALLRAYPHVDIEALHNFPPEVFENKELPPQSVPYVSNCPSIPAPPDTDNVNNLRPGNIRVVLSMGDSIIAGMSAKDTIIISLKEYRGLAFCIGGDTGVTTFPNILSSYTKLIGTSTGIGLRDMKTNGLNGAVSGAVNNGMLDQAMWLVKAMNNQSYGVNMQTDWKVLSIWIGSNNLCAVCNNAANNDVANFIAQLTAALNYLFANVPRCFINLIANLDVSSLYNINSGACNLIHAQVCPCTSDANKRALMSSTAKQYVAAAYTIAKEFNSRGFKDKAVVVQPFLVNNTITDRSLLSAADCFHPSAPAHALAAVALWNNMLTPNATKKTSWNSVDTPICPTADSVFPIN